jgi:hypothetical protein
MADAAVEVTDVFAGYGQIGRFSGGSRCACCPVRVRGASKPNDRQIHAGEAALRAAPAAPQRSGDRGKKTLATLDRRALPPFAALVASSRST